MRGNNKSEHGQAVVEFALIGTILFMLTVGLVDVGRAFIAYDALASAARFGARWGAVQGGTCGDPRTISETNADWCNGLGGQATTPFWMQDGNRPLQGNSTCPSSYDSTFTSYWTVSNLSPSAPATIASNIWERLDTSSSSSSNVIGNWTAGIDPHQVKVCIQMSSDAYDSTRTPAWEPVEGDWLIVYVYYPFRPVSGLFGHALTVYMSASSRYVVE